MEMTRSPMARIMTILVWIFAAAARAEELWPDLSRPAAALGGGESDAGVVVGIENYGFVPPVPGAEANAKAWYDYLTRTRGAAPGNVKLLLGNDATRDDIVEAAQSAASKAGPQGTLWFVFVGHGAPSADGKDGLLVGVDAQQKASSLQKRSLRREELLAALSKSRAGSVSVVLDACFSGRGQDGASIAPGLQPLVTVAAAGLADPRFAVLTAAKGDQFAGALPGAQRPAFSYLALGALRGWASGKDARVTAGAIWRYATDALEATLRGRNQTPDLMGREDHVLGASAGEKGPDLAALAKATAGGSGPEFKISYLPSIPKAQAPRALDSKASRLDFGSVDVDALEKYDGTVEFDKGEAAPEEKAQAWLTLAKQAPKFSAAAEKRAAEWSRYVAEKKAGEEARRRRLESRDSDWTKLSRLLALKVVEAKDKEIWSAQFAAAYLESPGIEPAAAAELLKYVAEGPTRKSLARLAGTAPGAPTSRAHVTAGKAGIQWVRIPGGIFMMGADLGPDIGPAHRVTLKAFEMSKTEVTNKQYKTCVEAGVCTAADSYEGGDDHPVGNVDWEQARQFAQWAGGRLPTEAEWEYAARSAGKNWHYPWGNDKPTCERAVLVTCRKSSAPVCSKTAGNTEQGLCDMLGNVTEWVQDGYHQPYDGAPTDGSAWETPGDKRRVYRGSSWFITTTPVTFRFATEPGSRHRSAGFRIAR